MERSFTALEIQDILGIETPVAIHDNQFYAPINSKVTLILPTSMQTDDYDEPLFPGNDCVFHPLFSCAIGNDPLTAYEVYIGIANQVDGRWYFDTTNILHATHALIETPFNHTPQHKITPSDIDTYGILDSGYDVIEDDDGEEEVFTYYIVKRTPPHDAIFASAYTRYHANVAKYDVIIRNNQQHRETYRATLKELLDSKIAKMAQFCGFEIKQLTWEDTQITFKFRYQTTQPFEDVELPYTPESILVLTDMLIRAKKHSRFTVISGLQPKSPRS